MRRSGTFLVVIALAGMCGGWTASGAPTSRNNRSTDAYLADVYTYEREVLNLVPTMEASFGAAASKLGAECRGVLKDAPRELPSKESLTGRQRSEAARRGRQLEDLQEEMNAKLTAALWEPTLPSTIAVAREISALRWSNGTLNRLIAEVAVEVESQFRVQLPDVCSDMKEWVASGYRTLSLASRVIVDKREAQQETSEQLKPTIHSLLSRYYGPAEEALIRKIAVVERKLTSLIGPFARISQRHLERTLGLLPEVG